MSGIVLGKVRFTLFALNISEHDYLCSKNELILFDDSSTCT